MYSIVTWCAFTYLMPFCSYFKISYYMSLYSMLCSLFQVLYLLQLLNHSIFFRIFFKLWNASPNTFIVCFHKYSMFSVNSSCCLHFAPVKSFQNDCEASELAFPKLWPFFLFLFLPSPLLPINTSILMTIIGSHLLKGITMRCYPKFL